MAAICGYADSQEQEPIGKPTQCLINPTQGKYGDQRCQAGSGMLK